MSGGYLLLVQRLDVERQLVHELLVLQSETRDAVDDFHEHLVFDLELDVVRVVDADEDHADEHDVDRFVEDALVVRDDRAVHVGLVEDQLAVVEDEVSVGRLEHDAVEHQHGDFSDDHDDRDEQQHLEHGDEGALQHEESDPQRLLEALHVDQHLDELDAGLQTLHEEAAAVQVEVVGQRGHRVVVGDLQVHVLDVADPSDLQDHDREQEALRRDVQQAEDQEAVLEVEVELHEVLRDRDQQVQAQDHRGEDVQSRLVRVQVHVDARCRHVRHLACLADLEVDDVADEGLLRGGRVAVEQVESQNA